MYRVREQWRRSVFRIEGDGGHSVPFYWGGHSHRRPPNVIIGGTAPPGIDAYVREALINATFNKFLMIGCTGAI